MKLQRKKKNCRRSPERKSVRTVVWRPGTGLDLRLRRGLMVGLLATVVLGSAWQLQAWLTGMDSLILRQVRVEGTFKQISRAEVQGMLAPYAGQGFFDLDVAAIKQMLQQQPWVRQATVRRHWPDGLVVTLLEQQPLARWGEQGLINAEAGVFYPGGKIPAGLPRLDGVAQSEHLMLTRLHDAGLLLQPLGLKIVAMSLDERRSWRIDLDNGLRLMLGREQDMQRIRRFVAFYPSLLAARAAEVGIVDLRYPNGIVLRWLAAQARAVQVG